MSLRKLKAGPWGWWRQCPPAPVRVQMRGAFCSGLGKLLPDALHGDMPERPKLGSRAPAFGVAACQGLVHQPRGRSLGPRWGLQLRVRLEERQGVQDQSQGLAIGGVAFPHARAQGSGLLGLGCGAPGLQCVMRHLQIA